MKKTLIVILVIIIIAILVIIINKKPNTGEPTVGADMSSLPAENTISSDLSQQETDGVTPAPESKEVSFVVNGGGFYFKPNVLKVKEGDVVNITFKNDEGFHDFVIDEFNVRTDTITGGKEAKVTFVANKKGSFEYYCSVGTHRQMGMKGTLVVE